MGNRKLEERLPRRRWRHHRQSLLRTARASSLEAGCALSLSRSDAEGTAKETKKRTFKNSPCRRHALVPRPRPRVQRHPHRHSRPTKLTLYGSTRPRALRTRTLAHPRAADLRRRPRLRRLRITRTGVGVDGSRGGRGRDGARRRRDPSCSHAAPSARTSWPRSGRSCQRGQFGCTGGGWSVGRSTDLDNLGMAGLCDE
jgi:hypothetical protein